MEKISVIVQGAVHPEFTPKCLKSIRTYLPKAYIILSTWEGTNTDGLDVDQVIFNKDPGAIARMYDPKRNIGDNPNNINRQIVSTLSGLKAVKTKYVLKMRTDFEIRHTGFMKYIDRFPKCSNEWRIFTNRVISILGDKPEEKPFFPYDFLFFGLTEDLLKLFDIPLMNKEDAEWFYTHEPVNSERYRFISGLFKYIPEQHIWMNCLAKKYPNVWSVMKDCSDTNPSSIQEGKKSFCNNFVCLDFDQYGIYPMKDSLRWLYVENRSHVFHYIDWLELYKKYCDPNFVIPIEYNWKNILKLPKYYKKLYKQWKRFFSPIKLIADSLCGLYGCIYYLLHILVNIIHFLPRLVYYFFKSKK